MKCFCGNKAIINGLCKVHFLEYFEETVRKTIDEFRLFTPDEKIVVATSGGKDSLATLFVLKKLGYNVAALLIDEGIKGYREITKNDLVNFCNDYGISYEIAYFKEEFGVSLDKAVELTKDKYVPCTICGIFRRYLLNKYSQKYDVIITGHNLDDESQSVLMNLLRNQIPILARIGPKTGIKDMGFTRRVKPLYFLTEKEVRLYVFLNKIHVEFIECPYAKESYRNAVGEFIHSFSEARNIKHNIIKFHLNILDDLRNDFKRFNISKCEICGAPTQQKICSACRLKIELKKKLESVKS